jgi:hypothetical protein
MTHLRSAATRLVSSYERRRPRPRNVTAISVAHLALQAILNVVVQPLISHQFRRLGSSSNQFRLPLRNRSPILKLATARGSVTCQFPGNR